MPIYEYQCTECGNIEEAMQKFSDLPLTTCNHCSGKLQKLISQTTFHLKGTGWYVTDYAGKSSNTGSSAEKKNGTSAEKNETAPSKTESTKSAAKPSE